MEENIESAIPDTLFKYCDEGVLAGLNDGTMMFSKPIDLNDPFEFLPDLHFLFGKLEPKTLSDLALASGHIASETPSGFLLTKLAHHWIRKVSGDWFITSLSAAEHNVRMWAQYGGNHAGIKLTLRLPEDMRGGVRRVRYDKPTRDDISKLIDPDLSPKEKGEIMKSLATRKGKDWKHEEEFRWFFRHDLNIHGSSTKLLNGKMKAFIPFSDECIQRVTVGYRSSESLLTSLFEIRKKRKAQWEVAKAKLSLNSFQFEDELLQIPDERRK